MNDQNIQNLVEFIKKNSNFSISQLEESALKTGYSGEEFNQALEIIGKIQSPASLEQNVLSANQQTLSPRENKYPNKKLPLVFLIIAALLIMGGVAGFYFLKQNKAGMKSTTPSPSPISDNLPKATDEPIDRSLENDPMKIFLVAFSDTDYKIITSGKIENIKQENDNTQTSSLDLNDGVIYTQKGFVIRIDKTNLENPEVVIINDDIIYILHPNEETYLALDLTNEMGKLYLNAVKASFPLVPLMEDAQKDLVAWQKISNDEWQADWKWKSPLDTEETTAKVRVIFEKTTNLIDTFSMKFEESQPWQDATFKYERIENIENLLTIPNDYKEEKLEF